MLAQLVVIAIFLTMFVLMVTERFEKHRITLVSGIATLVVVFGIIMQNGDAIINILNLRSIFTLHFWYSAGEGAASSSGINWETIIFLLGMMIMVEGMP